MEVQTTIAIASEPLAESREEAQERELVELFVAGDMAAFRTIYARYRQRIMSYCLYFMGDPTHAEDAFQEVFARVYTRREQLREAKALKSWLLLITRSVCLNMLRKSKFAPDFVSIDATRPDGSEAPEYPELSTGPADIAASMNDALQLALQRLAPMYREAFLLREFEGYEYTEIAEITGASVLNVKVRITRAKKRLRMLLAPYYEARKDSERRAARRSTVEEMDGDRGEFFADPEAVSI